MALVRRMEVDLALAGSMTAAARAAAADAGALVSVAVVDAGAHLVSFERMDGADVAGPVLARDKAATAVAHRVDTAELAALAAPDGELAGLAASGGGRWVTFAGGLPLWHGDRVVGGIGVSGGSAAQDAAAAEAGLQVYAAALASAGAEDA